MVIEKCGLSSDADDVGNRGKRDSQILLLQLLNKVQHNHKLVPESPRSRYRDLNEFEEAIKKKLRDMDFPLTSDQFGERDGLDEVKFLMAVDADTRLRYKPWAKESLRVYIWKCHLSSRMFHVSTTPCLGHYEVAAIPICSHT